MELVAAGGDGLVGTCRLGDPELPIRSCREVTGISSQAVFDGAKLVAPLQSALISLCTIV